MLKLKSNERRLYLQATGTTLLRVCSTVKHASFYEKNLCINHRLYVSTCVNKIFLHKNLFGAFSHGFPCL